MRSSAQVVICGAGIAGISVAHELARNHGMRRVVLVDERPPLTLTSDKSSEAYRNWWPGPDDAMIRLMNRSIDLLEDLARESNNRFLLNRRGYLWCTANPIQAEDYLDRLPKPYVDGGYYTKTRENRPLACPLPVEGAFVHGALSGFGLMASMGTAEVAAAHITGGALPDWAPAFDLARYDDPEYLARLEDWGDDGQL